MAIFDTRLWKFCLGWALVTAGFSLIFIMVPATLVALGEGDLFATGVGLLVLLFGYQLIELGYFHGTGEEFPYAISAERPPLGRVYDEDVE